MGVVAKKGPDNTKRQAVAFFEELRPRVTLLQSKGFLVLTHIHIFCAVATATLKCRQAAAALCVVLLGPVGQRLHFGNSGRRQCCVCPLFMGSDGLGGTTSFMSFTFGSSSYLCFGMVEFAAIAWVEVRTPASNLLHCQGCWWQMRLWPWMRTFITWIRSNLAG